MRAKSILKQNYVTIFYYCGLICITTGALPLLPLLALPFFPKEVVYAHWFLIPSFISISIGVLIYLITRPLNRAPISTGHSAVVVVFLWLYGCLLGAVPFAFDPQFTYLHGVFESISGWTTTGLTVVDTDTVPNLILLWRSIMQYIGGAGFAVIMLSILSGPSASSIYQAEGHNDEILPHVKQSAVMVMYIYLTYLAGSIFLYILAGMPVFDSINHAMTALATGGFSVKNESIGFYNSVPIEIVTIILMIIGHINFATHHLIFKGRWSAVLKNAEMKSSTVLLLIFVPITFLLVTLKIYNPAGSLAGIAHSFRAAAFEVISALTGTGFSTVSYDIWTPLGIFIIIIMMCAGGQTMSTSGGIKQYRLYLTAMSIYWSVMEQFIPKSAVISRGVYKGEKKIYIQPSHFRELMNYIVVYLLAFLLGSAITMHCGYPLTESMFEFASALGTVGLSMGIVSASVSPVILFSYSIGMFLGRLEFFVVFYCIVKIIRDIRTITSKE